MEQTQNDADRTRHAPAQRAGGPAAPALGRRNACHCWNRSYLAKAGRARFIEIAVLVPGDLQLLVTKIDALRDEIGRAIGGAGADRWLTITFTADPEQL